MAERCVFVKDAAKLSVEISDGCEWCDGLGKILFKGVFVNFRAELCSYRLDGRCARVMKGNGNKVSCIGTTRSAGLERRSLTCS